MKLSTSRELARNPWAIQRVGLNDRSDQLELIKRGTVGWGGNSGFHCLNLAVQFAARKIILVGFDMHLDGGVHWHGKHGAGLHNPRGRNVDRWRRVIDGAAETIATLGIEVINCSSVSALQNYRKMGFDEALRWQSLLAHS